MPVEHEDGSLPNRVACERRGGFRSRTQRVGRTNIGVPECGGCTPRCPAFLLERFEDRPMYAWRPSRRSRPMDDRADSPTLPLHRGTIAASTALIRCRVPWETARRQGRRDRRQNGAKAREAESSRLSRRAWDLGRLPVSRRSEGVDHRENCFRT